MLESSRQYIIVIVLAKSVYLVKSGKKEETTQNLKIKSQFNINARYNAHVELNGLRDLFPVPLFSIHGYRMCG